MKLDCGCELTDNNIYKPCYKHWKLIHDAANFKALTGGEIDMKASIELGVPVVKNCPETWMTPKEYEDLLRKNNV